ncbi:MAG: LysR family transcriptional regulator [Limnobacter sp.]|uniref:LysR family transcriptional regulator n=1 Tax=Limnobacter sp. TaxID=2003368 RepID=UPI00391CCC2E
MNITHRQLRLFLALVDTGSVSAAAQQMCVTQPTASMQLKEISEAVGLPVYEVIGKKVHLTEAGKALARTGRAIENEWDSFRQAIHAMQGLTKGRLRVAVVSTAKYFVPRLLGSFCSKHPQIDIALEVLNRDAVVQRLRDNMDDLYIMSRPPEDVDLSDEVFLPNPLVLVAANAAARKLIKQHGAVMDLNDLQDQRFILRESGSGTRLASDVHFQAHQFQPGMQLVLGSNEAIREAVAGGLGVAVLSMHALAGHRDVTPLPVRGFPIDAQWHVVHPKGKQLSPIASVFKAHLLSQAGKLR